jgi:hypothetical protein
MKPPLNEMSVVNSLVEQESGGVKIVVNGLNVNWSDIATLIFSRVK